jgi:hypothetical protein
MCTNFFSLPRELRDQIYVLVLLHEEPLDPWAEIFPRKKLTPGLFRANKTIHHETTSLFYNQSIFELGTGTPRNIASFLEQIGRSNADCIRHIHIDFPRLYVNTGYVYLNNYNLGVLVNIRSGFAFLSTLTMSQMDRKAHIAPLDVSPDVDSFAPTAEFEIITEGLKLVDINIRAIASLQDVIVELYEDGLSDHIRGEMKRLGWKIQPISYAEIKESPSSNIGDFDDEIYSGCCCDGGD